MHIFMHILIHVHILTGGGNNWIECVHIFTYIPYSEHSGLHRVEPEHALSLSGPTEQPPLELCGHAVVVVQYMYVHYMLVHMDMPVQ